MDKHISELGSDNKYFYVETQKELFNILNRKKSTKIPYL